MYDCVYHVLFQSNRLGALYDTPRFLHLSCLSCMITNFQLFGKSTVHVMFSGTLFRALNVPEMSNVLV